MESVASHPVHDRYQHLDVLRGFALLGILLVNFEWFTRPLQAIMLGSEPGLGGADMAADWLVTIFGEGKFYPLFSMLFGAGFALMADRAIKRAAPFWGIYLRRLLVLLVFGLAHTLLVWAGDILLIYALSALVMIVLFRKTPPRRLWKWALVFLIFPITLMWLGTLSIALTQSQPELQAEMMAEFAADEQALLQEVERAAAIHADGTFVDNVYQRIDDTIFKMVFFLFWATPIIGFFLIGRWLVVTGKLTHPREHQLYFRRWRARGLIIGLVCAVGATWLLHDLNAMIPSANAALGMTLATVAGIFMSLGYLSMITLASERLRFLAPAGQMALTNYLAQSIIWTWLIYGHGLGLWGELPRWSQIPLSLGFFSLQIVFSSWWLARFRFGPAEWLWRSLTYWQVQPMRHTTGQT